jgi:predicted AAA+ superfamily ATPase
MNASSPLYSRRMMTNIRDRMGQTPVLLVEGARSVGKSTLLRQLAREVGASFFDFDDDQVRQLANADLPAIAGGPLPVFVDEYQREPDLLTAIKARLNVQTEFGMFVLAGSTSFDSLPDSIQALTGRIQRVTLDPLAQAEIDSVNVSILDHIFSAHFVAPTRVSRTSRVDYVHRVTRGGFPLALAQPSDAARARWFDGYLTQVIDRDLRQVRRQEKGFDVRALVHQLASQAGRVINHSKVATRLGVSIPTVVANRGYLESLFVLDTLPAWGTTITQRVAKSPKLHMVDSGLASHLIGLSAEKLNRRDPSALTEFGYVLESFVVREVMRHATWMDTPIQFGHWRSLDGDEVDLIVERFDGSVVGVEVKAGVKIEKRDIRGLQTVKQRLGSSFAGGVVFHLGERAYEIEDKIFVMPVDALWSDG